MERVVAGARADLQARGLKMESMPIDPQIFEDQARRRVALGLIVGELVKKHDLAAKPQQVRALVDEHAASYEQPAEVMQLYYGNQRLMEQVESSVLEEQVVDWVLENAKVMPKAMKFQEVITSATQAAKPA